MVQNGDRTLMFNSHQFFTTFISVALLSSTVVPPMTVCAGQRDNIRKAQTEEQQSKPKTLQERLEEKKWNRKKT